LIIALAIVVTVAVWIFVAGKSRPAWV